MRKKEKNAARTGRAAWNEKRLFHGQGGAVKHQLIHALEGRHIQRLIQSRHAGSEFCRNILIVQLAEMAIIKVYILHMAIRPSYNHGHLNRSGMDAAKINVPDGFAQIIFVDLNEHRIAIITVDHDIGKAHILDQGIFISLIAHAPGIRIAGQKHTDPV